MWETLSGLLTVCRHWPSSPTGRVMGWDLILNRPTKLVGWPNHLGQSQAHASHGDSSMTHFRIFRLSLKFQLFDGPEVILEIHPKLQRFYVLMYIITTSCWCYVLQPQSCLPFYPDSVCPELAWRRIVWKWPSVAHICAFHGGLQARLWLEKIGLCSFVARFSQAVQRVAQENLFALWEVHHVVLGLWVCMKPVQWK